MSLHCVTLVVPAYQGAAYLPEFLAALSAQRFRDFQVIFVYDKSTDSTLSLLQDFTTAYPDLSPLILEKPTKDGVGKARDYAIDSGLIRSDYVTFLDADDAPHPDYLEKMVAKAKASDADMVLCGFQRIDYETRKVISTDMCHNPDEILDSSTAPMIPFFNPAPWNKLIKTAKIQKARFIHNVGTGEDEMFFLKVIPNCPHLAFVNEPLYDYFVHAGSGAVSTNKANYDEACQGYLEVKAFYVAEGGVCSSYLPLLEAKVFLRVALGTTTRISVAIPKLKKTLIRSSKRYLDLNFPGWTKNRYLSHKSCRKLGKKALYVWHCKRLYQCHLFGLFVWAYKTYTHLFHKDVKW